MAKALIYQAFDTPIQPPAGSGTPNFGWFTVDPVPLRPRRMIFPQNDAWVPGPHVGLATSLLWRRRRANLQ